jgi:hypothetical protein
MAIIYTYPTKTNPAADDLILISDSADGNKTKQISVSSLPSGSGGITLTTVGTSGAATLTGNQLNVPNYTTTGVWTVNGNNISYDTGTISTTQKFEGNINGALLQRVVAGETLAKGDAVYISGNDGNDPIVRKALASDATKMPAVGVALEAINAGTGGEVVTSGEIVDLGTLLSAYDDGSHLFISSVNAGQFVDTAPTGESNLIQTIGKVVKRVTPGAMTVLGAFRTNATPNLDQGSIFLGSGTNTSSTLAIGTANKVLKSSGTTASWEIPAGGSTTQFQYSNAGYFAGTNLLRFDADAIQIGIAGGSPEQGKIIMYSDGTNAPTIELKNSTNSHGVSIKGSTDAGSSADYSFILPKANGNNGQYLKLDSSLELEYTNIPTYPVTTYSNGIAHRVITATSTSAIEGEQYLTFDGTTLTVADVNSDVKITGNGISFPGQTDEMNDYEEGTWTPAPYSAGTAPTTSIATGTYIKVGDLVSCYFYLNITSGSSGQVDAMIIGGLPFSATNANGSRGSVNIVDNTGTNAVQQHAISGVVSGNQVTLKRLNITGVTSGSTISISGASLIDAGWFASLSLNYVLEGTIIFKV